MMKWMMIFYSMNDGWMWALSQGSWMNELGYDCGEANSWDIFWVNEKFDS